MRYENRNEIAVLRAQYNLIRSCLCIILHKACALPVLCRQYVTVNSQTNEYLT